jgi:nitrogen fixation/metabolism regulation signal transduction histidine kinase
MLANPVMLRAILVLVCAMSAFLLGLVFIRALRKNIAEESDVAGGGPVSLETLPLHLYNTVIQQLKQQKHELQVQSQTEQHRARTSETFSHAVLSNLFCGVLVFGPNGLVKTSNPAAKAILGFAAATGMGPEDIFRGAFVRSSRLASSGVPAEEDGNEAEYILLADEISAVLREGSQRREVEAEYETPAGKKRFLAVTVSVVPTVDGGLLGVACVINDRTEVEEIHQQQELQSEISAEMALQLRTSLTTISGYAQQLANSRDPELSKQLATDIAYESAQLDHSLGGFLTKKHAAQAVAVGNSGS